MRRLSLAVAHPAKTALHIGLLPLVLPPALRGSSPVLVVLAGRHYPLSQDHIANTEQGRLFRPPVPSRLPDGGGSLRGGFVRALRRVWHSADRGRVTFLQWGYAWHQRLGFDPAEAGFRSIYLENDLIGFGEAEGRAIVGYLCDHSVPYYDGRQPSELEGLLNACRPGAWRDDPDEARFVAVMRDSVQHKYRRYDAAADVTLDGRDVLVMGQVADDASWRFTETLVADNVDLVGRAVAAFPDARRLYFKAHPRWNRLEEDRARIAALYPQVVQLDPKLNFKTLIRMRPRVVVNTSGTGLDAGLAGCEVHSFGLSFYAGWGATIDHLPTPARRANRLGFEDIFVVTNLHYARHFHRDTLTEASTAEIVAALEGRGRPHQ